VDARGELGDAELQERKSRRKPLTQPLAARLVEDLDALRRECFLQSAEGL
jgi:hypothetical protein